MTRNNLEWMEQLQQKRGSTLTDLRMRLLRNLRKALASHPRVDDSFLEDIVQDALLRILDKLDQFQGRSQFLTWATSIAIRVAMSELRRSRWKEVSLNELSANSSSINGQLLNGDASPGIDTQRTTLFSALRDAIDNDLTMKQRSALLAELKGMPQDEIARHLGSNRNAVYKLTHDARKKLKNHLEAAGYTANDVVLISP